ncbi:hypothetical protein [Cohnella sp. GCM10027633]
MNAKLPQPSIDRIAAAMNKHLVPAAQNQQVTRSVRGEKPA